MDRRDFLKAAGLSAGAVMCRVPEADASLNSQVSERVIPAQDIIDDPTIGPVFDMNDDVSGLAGHFTGQLLMDYMDKYGLTHDSAISVMRWGLRQASVLGMMLAKKVVTIVFSGGGEVAMEIQHHSVFKQMYTTYGALLDSTGPNPLGQYWKHRV